MKIFIPVVAIVLLFCQMEFKREKNTDFSVLRIDTPEVKGEILENPVIKAKFKGGEKAFVKFLADNFKYPNEAENCASTIYVRFIIDKDGSVMKDCVKVAKSICPALDVEAIRVVQLSPNWTPATQNGRYVRQRLKVPIRIHIRK